VIVSSITFAERFPEQYPAVVDEWADPVATDDAEVAALRPLLKNTNLEFRRLKLTYSANRDGWNAAAFHRKVDRLGGGLVVCTTTDGLVCGGYNPKGWVGYGEARGSIAAFLFVYKEGLKARPTKLRKVGGPALAQQDLPECGPSFGADSLVIPLDGDTPKLARSKLGSYYERFPGGTNTLFGKRGASVELKDLKAYHGVYEEGEYIPFTDAEPFALY
jgi:TLD